MFTLSRHISKPSIQYFTDLFKIRSLNSWALAIRHASSPQKALSLYSQMHRQSSPLDGFCILYTLKSCTQLQSHITLQHLHAQILKLGFCYQVYVGTCLLGAYVLTSFYDARKLFDEMPVRNTVTWNTMIAGYSRSRDLKKASSLFNQMPVRDFFSWSSMIAAHVKNDNYKHGLSLFRDMVTNQGLKPDKVAAQSVLSACAKLGSIAFLMGKSIHGFIATNGWELNVELGTALVDMYCNCGSLETAFHVFDRMLERNVQSWTALICGLARHGCSLACFSTFEIMLNENVKPNELTFTGVLKACVESGLAMEGCKYFEMIEAYDLVPNIQHYRCMVDLLRKARSVEEVSEVIKTMKLKPHIVWDTFLLVCKKDSTFEAAKRAIKKHLENVICINNHGVTSPLSNLHDSDGDLNNAEEERESVVG